MSEFDSDSLDRLLKQSEREIREACSPFNGNCYGVALALYQIFDLQAEGFWSVYTYPQQVEDPNILPAHVAVQINGELFDAGGRLDQSKLLEEYAPEANTDLLRYDDTFPYEKAASNEVLSEVIDVYANSINNDLLTL